MFGIPELELRSEEAARVARAFSSGQELTGFTPSGPFWEWLYIAYVLVGVYGRRVLLILERRRAAAAAEDPPPLAPVPPVPPVESRSAMVFPPPPAPIAASPAPAADAEPTAADIAAALAGGADNVVGFERRMPGMPVSSIDERLSGL
jgi:hypothetical protein